MRARRSAVLRGLRGGLPAAVAFGVSWIAGGAAPAHAQTMYERRWTPVDYGSYTTVEECLSATERIAGILPDLRETNETRSARVVTGIWRDTMPRDPRVDNLSLRPLSDSVIATAQRCGKRFVEPQTSLEIYHWYVRLYLQANRDADAAALIARRLAAGDAKSDSTRRKEVLEVAYKSYLAARPARWPEAEARFAEWLLLEKDPLAKIMGHKDFLLPFTDCLTAADSARTRSHFEQIEKLAQNLTPADRVRLDALPALLRQAIITIIGLAVDELHMPSFVDSLLVSTPSYVAHRLSLMKHALGSAVSDMGTLDGLGQPVMPLTAKAFGGTWFRRDTALTWPAKGQPSIAYFMNGPSPRAPNGGGCLPVLDNRNDFRSDEPCRVDVVKIRRLAQRFPKADMATIAWSRSYMVYGTLNGPASAAQLNHWLHEVHHIPGALLSVPATFAVLPAPDGRRIEQEDQISRTYRHPIVVTDRAGLLVYAGNPDWSEYTVGRILQALMDQRPAPPAPARAGAAVSPPSP